MKEHIINVHENGTMAFIYADALRWLLELGEGSISRASHVEPGDSTKGQDPLGWYADMFPSGSPEILGPFDNRQEALDAEVAWLNEHLAMAT